MTQKWPYELDQLLSDPRAVPLKVSNPLPKGCSNCGGTGTMMIFMIQHGPYPQPNGAKVKWIDMPDGAGLKSGWYAGELKCGWCPVCHNTWGRR